MFGRKGAWEDRDVYCHWVAPRVKSTQEHGPRYLQNIDAAGAADNAALQQR